MWRTLNQWLSNSCINITSTVDRHNMVVDISQLLCWEKCGQLSPKNVVMLVFTTLYL